MAVEDLDLFRNTSESQPSEPSESAEGTAATVGDVFGDSGSVDDERSDDFVVSDDKVVLWFPEDCDELLAIRMAEYSRDTGYTVRYTEINESTSSVYVVTGGDAEAAHPVQCSIVDELADALDLTPAGLLDMAKVNINRPYGFPVVFDLTDSDRHEGRVMVAPVGTDPKDMHEKNKSQQEAI